MREPGWLETAGEGENKAVCCHCHFWEIAKDWQAGCVWRSLAPPFTLSQEQQWWLYPHICPVLGTQCELHPCDFSFTPQKQGLLSLFDRPWLWHFPSINLPRTAVKETACRVVGWDHKMEKKQGHCVAVKVLVTCQSWCGTLSCQVAQSAPKARAVAFTSHTTWSARNASCPMGRCIALLHLRKRNSKCLCMLSRMAEGIYWIWLPVWIFLTKAFVCISQQKSHFRCPWNLKGFTSRFWTVVGTISSHYRSLICEDTFPKHYICVIW